MSTELVSAMTNTVRRCLENGKPGPTKIILNNLLYERCSASGTRGKQYAKVIKKIAEELQQGVDEGIKGNDKSNIKFVLKLIEGITQDRRSLLPHKDFILRTIQPSIDSEHNITSPETTDCTLPPNLLSNRFGYERCRGDEFQVHALSKDNDDEEYTKIKNFVEESNVHNLALQVVAIEKVFNPELEKDYQKLKLSLNDPDPSAVEYSFHGTNVTNIESIAKYGFHPPTHPSLLYGMGIYFASNSSKCVWFVEPWDIDALQNITEPYTWPGVPQQLVVAELAVGNYKEVQSPTPDETQESLLKEGYDSIKAIANSQHKKGCRYEEWVVYNPKQAFPRYIVHYRKTHMPLDSKDPTFDVSTNKWIETTKTKIRSKKTNEVGLVIGKFMPIHEGHVSLIETAKSESEKVVIIVCDNGDKNIITGRKRVRLIKELFPSNRIQIVLRLDMTEYNLPSECVTEDEWKRWSSKLINICEDQGFGAPNCIFGGEQYVSTLSKHMNISSHVVERNDPKQTTVVSATEVRESPITSFEKIPQSVKRDMAKRVVLFGSESVGKTTMAKQLANKYNCCWVPEGARRILGDVQVTNISQMEFIAAEQLRSEDHICAYNNSPIVFCDTDLVVTTVYADYYFPNECPDWIRHAAEQRQYSLYLFLSCEVPWVSDPLRDLSGSLRLEMETKFKSALTTKTNINPTRVVYITGSDWEGRFNQAVVAIDDLLSS